MWTTATSRPSTRAPAGRRPTRVAWTRRSKEPHKPLAAVPLPADVTADFARLIDVLVDGKEVRLEVTVRRIDDEDR